MEQFAAIHRLFGRLSAWAVWAGGFALLLSAFMVTIEVIGRKLGGTEVLPGFTLPQFRVPGSDEYSGYVFAGATTWAYAYCLLHRSHIRIDALYNLLPRGVRALFDIFALSMLFAYMAYFTSKAVPVFIESWERDSVSVTPQLTPLWIPQIVWVTGLIFFNLTLIFMIVYTVTSLFVRGSASVQALAGTMSVSEEMEEETRGIQEIDR
ncbi:MAG: TRAP transporter small permease [Paracoccaceae bacterium]|nr:TRAP transporter small permease [Paracoccaceae bacterium]